ncbi:mechanosensitive ion channel family protein [candidate division KSB1 bacterium]|nr:mechanosensitive ion channel family protein [candidate division KSB1 bacterium]
MIEFVKDIQQRLNIDLTPLFIQFINFIPNFISGIVIFFMFYGLYRFLRFILIRTLDRAKTSLTVINLLTKVLKYTIFSIAILLMADQFGIQIVTLLSTVGIAGIAVGLAAQQTVSNIISGIIILISRPFKEGDWVELGDVFGKVVQISLRSTHLLTVDNLMVDYPNRVIVESKIVNHTFHESIRLRIGVGIAYKEYIPDAQEVIKTIVKGDDRFKAVPEPEVVVAEIADSSINLELLAWLKDSRDEIPATYDLRKRIKLALDKAGIQIPFPHRQLFIDDINTDSLAKLMKKTA